MQRRTPVLFIGHGTPMNTLEDNVWTRKWRELGELLDGVEAIVMLSAHWYTQGTLITKELEPKMIYDMYGFPDELYAVDYPAKNPEIPRDLTFKSIADLARLNDEWGYDHGNYSVLYQMFPKANIPLHQVSINADQRSQYHFDLGKRLKLLREKNVLIIGSGNIVHNLRKMSMSQEYPWAKRFDDAVVNGVKSRNYSELIALEAEHPDFKEAAPTPDHYYPFLTALGASEEGESVTIFNRDITAGSLSMTSYAWGLEEYLNLSSAP